MTLGEIYFENIRGRIWILKLLLFKSHKYIAYFWLCRKSLGF